MNIVQIIGAVGAIVAVFGIGWRILDSFRSKKDDEKRRMDDEVIRQERVKIIDLSLDRLLRNDERLLKTLEDTNREVRRINGTVARQQQWIEEHRRVADPALASLQLLQLDVRRLQDQVKDLQDRLRETKP